MPPKNCKGTQFSHWKHYLLMRHEHSNRCAPLSVPRNRNVSCDNARFCFRHRTPRINGDAGSVMRFAPWSDDTNTFFTIGHSTRTIVEFVDLLRESGVDLVIDVRSMPRSRTNPQFNQESLPEALAPWQIGYRAYRRARRPAGKVARRRAFAQCLLASAQLSELCRLCPDGAVRRRPGAAPGTRRGATVRDHVRRSGLVALPPPDHCRLPSGRRRASDAHSRKIACRCGEPDTRRRRSQRWDGGLSRPRSATGMRQRLSVGSAAEGDVQSGDDADHGESVTAEPDRDYCYKPDT